MKLLVAGVVLVGCFLVEAHGASAACGLETQAGVPERLQAIESQQPDASNVVQQTKDLATIEEQLRAEQCSDYDKATLLKSQGGELVLLAWTNALRIRTAGFVERLAPAACVPALRSYDRYEFAWAWGSNVGSHWNQRIEVAMPAIPEALAAQRDPNFAHVRDLYQRAQKALAFSLPVANASEKAMDGAFDHYKALAIASGQHLPLGSNMTRCTDDAQRSLPMLYGPWFIGLY